MLVKADWQSLIPHQGAMCLLDGVLAWDAAHIIATSASHRSADNPLRRDGALHALHLCEYGAQAMAVHGALLARVEVAQARAGLLVSLREVRLDVARIDHLPGLLEIRAERLLDTGASWQYRFEARHDGRLLAAGRATVMLGDSAATPGASND